MSSMHEFENNWRIFCALFTDSTAVEIDELLTLFLTRAEREDITARFSIVRELLQGTLTHREIAEKHGLSIAKISRGSNALKDLRSSDAGTILLNSLKKKL